MEVIKLIKENLFFQIRYLFMKAVIFMLILVLSFSLFSGIVNANQAADFYEDSNVNFYYDDGIILSRT